MNFDTEKMKEIIYEMLNKPTSSEPPAPDSFCNLSLLENNNMFCNMLKDFCGTNYENELDMECFIFTRSFDGEIGKRIIKEVTSGNTTLSETISWMNNYMHSKLGITSAWRFFIIQVFINVFEWPIELDQSDFYEIDKTLLHSLKSVSKVHKHAIPSITMLSHIIVTNGVDVAALTQSGTLFSTKKLKNPQKWCDLIQVSAGEGHIAGLKSNGTVVDSDDELQLLIKDWKDIIMIEAGSSCIIGLNKNGQVLAVGSSAYGKCNTGEWKNIVDISAYNDSTIGRNNRGEIFITDKEIPQKLIHLPNSGKIVKIYSGGNYITAVYDSGSICYYRLEGEKNHAHIDADAFNDIVMLSSNSYHTVGVNSKGNCITSPYTPKGEFDKQYDYGNLPSKQWSNLLAVTASNRYIVGLKNDGSVICHGAIDKTKKRMIEGWIIFSDLNQYIEKYSKNPSEIIDQHAPGGKGWKQHRRKKNRRKTSSKKKVLKN